MKKWILLALMLLLSACGSAAGGAQDGLLQVDNVEVQVAESSPPQVSVRVQGMLGNGCYSLGEIRQQRNGNTIEVTITTKHNGSESCTMIAQMIDEKILLEGDFPSGEYIVRVNGVERTFRV
jgi:inhibitor of cysteine peptidase